MATTSDDTLREQSAGARADPDMTARYMIAPAQPGANAESVHERVKKLAGARVLRTFPVRESLAPPVTVARISDEGVRALHQAFGNALLIEPDVPLRAASFVGPSPLIRAPVRPAGRGFNATLQVMAEGQPVDQAEVQIMGEQRGARGITGKDGKVALHIDGERPETMIELLVLPRTDCWPLYQDRPRIDRDAVTVINLHRLSPGARLDWGGTAMGFDRLPAAPRGAGVSVALIDSGVAISHKQLGQVGRGIDLTPGARTDARSWAEDTASHGTACASIISAAPGATHGVRGHAPQAELHVCKLPEDAHCSDLVAAIDYCLEARIDVACLGYGCQSGSLIVEQRIIAAKQQGIALIAAAGNTSGPVHFPACSPHVLAVGAIGQVGTFPDDSPQAAQASAGVAAAHGLFVPPFACQGPELDLCAPGVAVIACASPDGYAAYDGSSLAASHVTALADLVLAEHGDFRHAFSARDFRRVERLFQILKETARPVGHYWHTGAGFPDVFRAMGRTSQATGVAAPLEAGLGELRSAMRRIDAMRMGLGGPPLNTQSPRGPAAVSPVPLNVYPWSIATPAGGPGDFQALKTAMIQAGLSSSN
jgi:subtilisin